MKIDYTHVLRCTYEAWTLSYVVARSDGVLEVLDVLEAFRDLVRMRKHRAAIQTGDQDCPF
jgi:hypothetical protein